MRKHTGFLIGSVLFCLSFGSASAVEPARMSQSEPGSAFQKQRAPGVPLAPAPGVVEQRERALVGEALVSPPRTVKHASNGSQMERDPSMPRGVPPIIAP